MPESADPRHKKCSLCFIQKPLSEFMSISTSKSGKKLYGTVCCSCLGIDKSKFHLHSFQKKLKRLFSKLNGKASIFDKSKNAQENQDDDEGGSGGKKSQLTKNVETLSNEIELAKEKAQLDQENQVDKKQKKLFEKHTLELNKYLTDSELEKQENSAEALDAEQEAKEKEREKKESAQELENREQDETDAIAGKIQRDAGGSRKNSRAARFGGLGLGFGLTQQSSQSNNSKTSSSTAQTSKTSQSSQEFSNETGSTENKDNQSKTGTEKSAKNQASSEQNQENKTALQKAASLLFNAQQTTPNNNAPARAAVSNRITSPSEAASNMFAHKTSGHQQATQLQNARETQSSEATQRVDKVIEETKQAIARRWGK